jgi:hypothetical protein
MGVVDYKIHCLMCMCINKKFKLGMIVANKLLDLRMQVIQNNLNNCLYFVELKLFS